MFDIANLDTRTRSEAGVQMPLINPRSGAPILDDAGAPVTISLLGPNSAKFKEVMRKLQLRRVDMGSRGVKMAEEDFERERFETLVAVTVGWSFDKLDAKDFAFSPENARIFWSDGRWDWVRSQAHAFCQQDGNFLPSS